MVRVMPVAVVPVAMMAVTVMPVTVRPVAMVAVTVMPVAVMSVTVMSVAVMSVAVMSVAVMSVAVRPMPGTWRDARQRLNWPRPRTGRRTDLRRSRTRLCGRKASRAKRGLRPGNLRPNGDLARSSGTLLGQGGAGVRQSSKHGQGHDANKWGEAVHRTGSFHEGRGCLRHLPIRRFLAM